MAAHLYHILSLDTKANKYKILNQLQSFFSIDFDVLTYCDEADIGQQEAIYINKYFPLLNYQIPYLDDPKHFKTNKRAKEITYEEVFNYITQDFSES